MDTQTREIPIPADLLVAVFPPTERPEPVPPISMWELAADAIRAAELRSELGTTAELPAISTEDIRTVCCPDCGGTGEHYERSMSSHGPDCGEIVRCSCKGSFGYEYDDFDYAE